MCFVGKDEKGTHLHYVLADFGDFGEELQGEYQADDAEAAGCYAAVFVFRQRFSFILSSGCFYVCSLFSVSLRLALASGEMRTHGLCDAWHGACRRGRGDWNVFPSYTFNNRPGPMPRMLGCVLYLWR